MKRYTIVAAFLVLALFLVCANCYCEDKRVTSDKENAGDLYTDAVPAYSSVSVQERAAALEMIVENKNALNIAAQKINKLNPYSNIVDNPVTTSDDDIIVCSDTEHSSINISNADMYIQPSRVLHNQLPVVFYDPDHSAINFQNPDMYIQPTHLTEPLKSIAYTGDVVINGPLTISGGQTLSIDGTLTINSGGSIISDGYGQISNTGSSMTISNTYVPNNDIEISGSYIIPDAQINLTEGGTIQLDSGATMASTVVKSKEDTKKGPGKEKKDEEVKFTRDRIQKQRQGIADMFNSSGIEDKDKGK